MAYARGEETESPEEIEAGRLIDRFGVSAVYGSQYVMAYHEMNQIKLVENILMSYQSRSGYRDRDGNRNWSEWAARYPDAAALLAWAEGLDNA